MSAPVLIVGSPDDRLVPQAALTRAAGWYGGAPLLGVAGYCLICHGRSDARAIKNAIRVGKQLHQSGINAKIVESVGSSIPSE